MAQENLGKTRSGYWGVRPPQPTQSHFHSRHSQSTWKMELKDEFVLVPKALKALAPSVFIECIFYELGKIP